MIEEELKNQELEEKNDSPVDDSLITEEATEVKEPKKGKKVKKKKSKARTIIEWVITGVFGLLFAFFGIAQIDGMVHAKEHYGQYVRFGVGSFLVLTNSMEPVYKVNEAIITYNEDVDAIVERFSANKAYNEAKIAEFIINHPEAVDESDNIDKNNEDYIALEKTFKHLDITFVGVNKNIAITPDDPTLTSPVYPKQPVPVTHRLREVHINEDVEKGKGHYTFIAAGINTGGELALEHQYQAFNEQEILGTVKVKSEFLGGFYHILSSPWGLLIFLLIPALYLIISSALDILKALKEPEEKPAGGAPAPKGDPNNVLSGLSEKEKERLKKEMLEQMLKDKERK